MCEEIMFSRESLPGIHSCLNNKVITFIILFILCFDLFQSSRDLLESSKNRCVSSNLMTLMILATEVCLLISQKR